MEQEDLLFFYKQGRFMGREMTVYSLLISCPDDLLSCRDVKFNVSTQNYDF
jgi:hypothetical protein